MIHLFYPYLPEGSVEEVSDTLRSRWIGQAHKVDNFEFLFGSIFSQQYPVALNSGTAALETAYDLLGLKHGDEVITTPLTCTATNIPLLRRGVKLVWADINPDTLCLDRNSVLEKMTNHTKAIVTVHLGGIQSDLGNMPVPVVSDACQALGIFTGDYTCNSFQAIKHITTGDGGMLTVNNEEEYRKAKLLRWFGIDREKKKENNWSPYTLGRKMTFDIELLGYKRQMTDIAASLGIVGLSNYTRMINYRNNLANIYKARLADVPRLKIVNGDVNTWWLFTVLVEDRDSFSKMLYSHSIDNNMAQVRNDIYRVFGGKRQELPVMNHLEDKYISIPLNNHITEQDVNFVCDCIEEGW